ncbi:MAG: hypothetical protein ACRD3E_09310 [Terriglobales bacterium]
MKAPSNEVELAVSSEDTRYQLKDVLLDAENGRIIATDGHMIVRTAVDMDGLRSGVVPPGLLRLARAFSGDVTCIGDELVIRVKLDDSAKYPKSDSLKWGAYSGSPSVTLNLELLKQLVTAMDEKGGDPSFSMWIKGPTDPILVAFHRGQSVGLLMPQRNSDSITAEDVLKRGARKPTVAVSRSADECSLPVNGT